MNAPARTWFALYAGCLCLSDERPAQADVPTHCPDHRTVIREWWYRRASDGELRPDDSWIPRCWCGAALYPEQPHCCGGGKHPHPSPETS